MEPIFIYFNKLKSDKDKKFMLEFSSGDKLQKFAKAVQRLFHYKYGLFY